MINTQIIDELLQSLEAARSEFKKDEATGRVEYARNARAIAESDEFKLSVPIVVKSARIPEEPLFTDVVENYVDQWIVDLQDYKIPTPK